MGSFLHRCKRLRVAFACAAVVATASVGLPASPALGVPPAQTILYVATDAPLTDSTNLNVAVYGWAIGADKALGVYVGPGWSFLEDKLTLYLRAGGYVNDLFAPLVNFEMFYESGNFNVDWFNDVYYIGDSDNMGGAYSWLSTEYWWKGLYIGAMADVQKEQTSLLVNAGPVFGFGNKKLSLGIAPIYSFNDPKDADRDGFGVRVLVNMEFSADEEKAEVAADAKPCDDCEDKDGKGAKPDEKKADDKKDDAKKDDAKAADDEKDDDEKEDDKKPVDNKASDKKPADKKPGDKKAGDKAATKPF